MELKNKYYKLSVLLIALAPFLLASNYAQQQSTLYPYKNNVSIQDDFLYGLTSSGNIGTGWGFAGGTIGWIAGETNRPGLIRRDSGAVINTLTRLDWETAIGGVWETAQSHRIILVIRLGQVDADTQMRIGAMNSSSGVTPVNGIYFEKLGADTNWFCVTRSAAVQTRTDSSIAADTNFHDFAYTRDSSGVQFAIDGTNVCGAPATTNIPASLTVGIVLTNLVAASKTYDVDYAQFTQTLQR